MRVADFIVIGGMKCGTSELHDQLAARSGLFMSDPKEPNFFSDDSVYARGESAYAGLFEQARPDQRCGESSTHYTKLPDHPAACSRMREMLDDVRLVYVMRDPVGRIVSQYVHDWSENAVRGPIEDVVTQHERFVAYSSYARQLEPYLHAYGPERILPVFFERLVSDPEPELERICAFIGDPSGEPIRWERARDVRNASAQRVRKSLLRDLVRNTPFGGLWRKALPEAWRAKLKSPWQLRERPELSEAARNRIAARLDPDLARLGTWLGIELSCASWRQQVGEKQASWTPMAPGPRGESGTPSGFAP